MSVSEQLLQDPTVCKPCKHKSVGRRCRAIGGPKFGYTEEDNLSYFVASDPHKPGFCERGTATVAGFTGPDLASPVSQRGGVAA